MESENGSAIARCFDRSDSRSLPALPSLAQQCILVHCSSADLAALRACSHGHRQFVDETITRLYPWIVNAPIPDQPETPAARTSSATAPAKAHLTEQSMTREHEAESPSSPARKRVRFNLPPDPPARFPSFRLSLNPTPAPPPPDHIPSPTMGPGPYAAVQQLVLRHHPHLDRSLDPSAASFDGDGPTMHPHTPSAFSALQSQTIHLPRRLRGGIASLGAMPHLTALSASLLCVTDAAAARAATWEEVLRRYRPTHRWRQAVLGMDPNAGDPVDQLHHQVGAAAAAGAGAGGEGDAIPELPVAAAPGGVPLPPRPRPLHEQVPRLRETLLNDQMVAALTALPGLAPHLMELTLTELPCLDGAFAGVAACSGITRLVLSTRQVPRVGGRLGADAAEVADMAFRGIVRPDHLTTLAQGLPSLRHLDLHTAGFGDGVDFGCLAALTRLSYVRLNQAARYDSVYGSRYERRPSDFSRTVLLGPLVGLERLAGLPQLHSLALTGLDCPPASVLAAFPAGGGPLRSLALRKLYRIGGAHLAAVGRLTELTELQLAADWWLHPGSGVPARLQLLAPELHPGLGPGPDPDLDEAPEPQLELEVGHEADADHEGEGEEQGEGEGPGEGQGEEGEAAELLPQLAELGPAGRAEGTVAEVEGPRGFQQAATSSDRADVGAAGAVAGREGADPMDVDEDGGDRTATSRLRASGAAGGSGAPAGGGWGAAAAAGRRSLARQRGAPAQFGLGIQWGMNISMERTQRQEEEKEKGDSERQQNQAGKGEGGGEGAAPGGAAGWPAGPSSGAGLSGHPGEQAALPPGGGASGLGPAASGSRGGLREQDGEVAAPAAAPAAVGGGKEPQQRVAAGEAGQGGYRPEGEQHLGSAAADAAAAGQPPEAAGAAEIVPVQVLVPLLPAPLPPAEAPAAEAPVGAPPHLAWLPPQAPGDGMVPQGHPQPPPLPPHHHIAAPAPPLMAGVVGAPMPAGQGIPMMDVVHVGADWLFLFEPILAHAGAHMHIMWQGGGGEAGGGERGRGGGGGGGGGRAAPRDVRLEPLARLRKLQSLHLSVGRIFGTVNLDPAFLTHLTALTALTNLTLRCVTVDWSLMSVLAPLPRLSHLAMHYFEGRSNIGSKIAEDLLSWRNLSAVTTLNLGAFEAHQDADIILRALPATRITSASVFGMRGCRPRYDVFEALTRTASLTKLTVQGSWMIPRVPRGATAAAARAAAGCRAYEAAAAEGGDPPAAAAAADPGPSVGAAGNAGDAAGADAVLRPEGLNARVLGLDPPQTLAALAKLPLLRSLTLDPSLSGSGGFLWGVGGGGVPAIHDVAWLAPQPGAAAAAAGGHVAGGGDGEGEQAAPAAELPQVPPALQPLAAAQPEPPQQDALAQEQVGPHLGVVNATSGVAEGEHEAGVVGTAAAAVAASAGTSDGRPAGGNEGSSAGGGQHAADAEAGGGDGGAADAEQPILAPEPVAARPLVFKEVPVLFDSGSDEDGSVDEGQEILDGAGSSAGAGPSGPRPSSRRRNGPASLEAATATPAADAGPTGTGLQETAMGVDPVAPGGSQGPPAAAASTAHTAQAAAAPPPPAVADSKHQSEITYISDSSSDSDITCGPAAVDGHLGRSRGGGGAAAAAAAAAAVDAAPLSLAERWILQLSHVTQLTCLRLERWGIVPPAALAPLQNLRRLQLTGLRSLDAGLLATLGRLPTLTYLTLEGRGDAHAGISAYATLSRMPYMPYDAVQVLTCLTRLRLLFLAGFALAPPPQSGIADRRSATAAAAAAAAAAGSAGRRRKGLLIGDCQIPVTIFGGSGSGRSVSGGGGAGGGRGVEDLGELRLGQLLESLGRLRGLRYLGLCLYEPVKGAHVTQLCASLPGLRMLSLPADAGNRGWWALRSQYRRRPLDVAPEAVGAESPAPAPVQRDVAPAAEGLRAGLLGPVAPEGRAGGGGRGSGSEPPADPRAAAEGLSSGRGATDGNAGRAERAPEVPAGAAPGSGEPDRRGGARGGGSGSGGSWSPPPNWDHRPFAEQLRDVTAAVYGGLSEGDFWRVVEGLDEEIRRDGALVGA